MKAVLYILIGLILGNLMAYAFGAFVSWDPNLASWTSDGRFFCVLFGSVLGVCAGLGLVALESDK